MRPLTLLILPLAAWGQAVPADSDSSASSEASPPPSAASPAPRSGGITIGTVNFAGHFVIGICTCGTGCHYLFMWDARTGKLYRNFPFDLIDVGPFSDEQAAPIEYAGETFRANSRLLIIDGCREDTCDCGVKYYLWNGTVFQMLRKRVSRIPPSCKK